MRIGNKKIQWTMQTGSALAISLGFGAAFVLAFFYFLLRGAVSRAAISLLFLLILLLLHPLAHLLKLSIPPACLFLLLFLCLGALLGSCFNFYFRFPLWDILLHALAGWAFAAVGYAICTLLFPKSRNSRIFPYLFFGVIFSLAIGLLWELFEAGATALLPVDMQEDSIVFSIKSFFLSGTHDYAISLPSITETVIHYGDGQALRIAGYLDLGLADTLSDMAICLLGNALFLLLFPLDRILGGRLLPRLLPRRTDEI